MFSHRQFSALILVLAALITQPVLADAWPDVQVLALSEGRAILRIEGNRRVLSAGETSPEGVKLVSSTSQEAMVQSGDRQEMLELGMVASPITRHKETVALYADGRGFFHANGKINGRSVRFLVDTGANTVALSSDLAKRLGIDFRSHGKPGIAQTASGIARMHGVVIEDLEVEGMRLQNIEAGVLDGPNPDPPLLGMSALRFLGMKRSGSRMELEKP